MTRFRWMLVWLASLGAPALGSQLVDSLRAGGSPTVVFYGTSLTAGGAWVPLLGQWLDPLPGTATYINSGMPALASGSGVLYLQSRVLDYQPDVVFIEFSINDAYVGYGSSGFPDSGLTPAIAKANLNHMIDRILDQNASTEVILQTMNPTCGSQAEARPDQLAYVQNYIDVAQARDLLLVHNFPRWQNVLTEDPSLYMTYVPDCAHPELAGIQNVMMPLLKRKLQSDARTVVLGGAEGLGHQVVPEPGCFSALGVFAWTLYVARVGSSRGISASSTRSRSS